MDELDSAAVEKPGRFAEGYDQGRAHDPTVVLVKLKHEVDPDSTFVEPRRHIVESWWEVTVPPGISTEQFSSRLMSRPGVDVVDLSYAFPIADAVVADLPDGEELAATNPNDPLFGFQWNFPAIQIPDVWDRATGSGAVVAVLDTGIIPSHQTVDLACRSYLSEYNAYLDVSGAGSSPDTFGHGTHVAGTVAQCTDNGRGVAGVAPQARIMPVDVFDSSSSSPMWTSAALARGIRWAADNGADVINMSLGTTNCPAPCTNPLVSDALYYAAARDVVLVAASGNANSSSLGGHFPANHPEVIAVGATETRNLRAPYSNHGSALDLVAPGGDNDVDRNGDGLADGVVQETLAIACGSTPPPNTVFCAFEGTSMASPHVAGTVALMRSAVPGATRNQIRTALRQSALDLGSAGFDNIYGFGLLQADDALAYLQSMGADNSPPTWPGEAAISILSTTPTSVSVDWPNAFDNVGVVGYEVSLDGSVIGSVAGSAATISGLEPVSAYDVSIRAVDHAGNRSVPITVRVVSGGTDSTPPVWGQDAEIRARDVFETDVTVVWDAHATDVSGIEGYRVFAGPYNAESNTVQGSLVAVLAAPATGYQISGLLAGRQYGAWVEAVDPAGNVSTDGPITVFMTATDFRDSNGHLFERDIEWLSGSRVTAGCNPPEDDLFCPDESVLRGQMGAFLVRALEIAPAVVDQFEDDDGSIFEADINALAQSGITLGCNPPSNSRYCPRAIVTRGQMASFIVRGLDLPLTDSGDVFGDDNGSPHEANIEALARAGITRGCNPPTNDRFCPDEPVTRGQMAAFLYRALRGNG